MKSKGKQTAYRADGGGQEVLFSQLANLPLRTCHTQGRRSRAGPDNHNLTSNAVLYGTGTRPAHLSLPVSTKRQGRLLRDFLLGPVGAKPLPRNPCGPWFLLPSRGVGIDNFPNDEKRVSVFPGIRQNCHCLQGGGSLDKKPKGATHHHQEAFWHSGSGRHEKMRIAVADLDNLSSAFSSNLARTSSQRAGRL